MHHSGHFRRNQKRLGAQGTREGRCRFYARGNGLPAGTHESRGLGKEGREYQTIGQHREKTRGLWCGQGWAEVLDSCEGGFSKSMVGDKPESAENRSLKLTTTAPREKKRKNQQKGGALPRARIQLDQANRGLSNRQKSVFSIKGGKERPKGGRWAGGVELREPRQSSRPHFLLGAPAGLAIRKGSNQKKYSYQEEGKKRGGRRGTGAKKGKPIETYRKEKTSILGKGRVHEGKPSREKKKSC